MKQIRIANLALLLLIVPATLHAQNGCVNSPENPTALLALCGVAGVVCSNWRSRR